MLEAQQSGLSVPDDLSVAGFDDIELAANFAPAPTTVHAPVEEICALAGDYLVAWIEGRPARDHLPLEARLVVCQSISRPQERRRNGRDVAPARVRIAGDGRVRPECVRPCGSR